MSLFLLAAALAVPMPHALPAHSRNCDKLQPLLTAGAPGTRAHTLAEEPSANLILPVARMGEDGCLDPLIVKTGNTPKR
jgi:hypothetical protein